MLREGDWSSWLRPWRVGGELKHAYSLLRFHHIVSITRSLVPSCFLRLAYRDIGGSDPERMAAPRVAEYVQELFKDSPVKVVRHIRSYVLINPRDPLFLLSQFRTVIWFFNRTLSLFFVCFPPG